MATDDFWGRFRRWRRSRPFWGGLFLLLSGFEMFLSANMNLGNLELHLGPQGFLSYLLPLIMVLTGILVWATPAQRLFYGIVGLLTALYSFLGLNLGGFILGMMLGILGGALVIAWGPPRVKPTASPDPSLSAPSTDEPPSSSSSSDSFPADDVEIAGHDDRPTQPILRPSSGDTEIIPGMPPEEPRGGVHPRALGVILLVAAVTSGVLIAGSGRPARAVECPEGLPSRSVATSPSSTSPAPASTAPETPAEATRTVPPGGPADTSQPAAGGTSAPESSASPPATTTASSSPSAPAAAAEGDEGSNPVEEFFDGLGNLLGIGDASPSASATAEPSAPSTSPASSQPTTPAATSAPATSAPPTSAPASSAAATTTSAPATTKPAASATSPTAEEIPCLGPRVMGKVAGADDVPRVALKPGVMEVDSLTMYDSTYDGVVDLPTATGSFKALKFSMSKAVNKPFTLTIDERGNAQTVIKSNELVTDGNVRFYTPQFKGKLFGLIPVTFTPEQPPPLTLPVLWFTDVTIQLAYVRCDTLTADPLNIQEIVSAS
ncbi:hypothetical protein Ade02nite_51680 [Paractinoplanes deccanensis]|uniref:Uncharacterized protein n=1 Tax=Paractinoplanes deccanensis TaxID=113561 RepID=A0ABQ3Y972_9ACTN|nr:DUF6114 domain-containing protein [Actinoplanes deccanensis]GID76527.1 hypothetical protein Ade02nite_51680 [Actinoplanes deccanensis]